MTTNGAEAPKPAEATSGVRMSELGRDEKVTLSDGRVIGIRHYGTEGGKPVAFFHGWPGSRFECSFGHQPAIDAGIHLIGFDRPGFGQSDFNPNHTTAGWAADVAEVMDHLGIDKFGVIGVSGGGPFALACGAKIPERLTGVAFVSGGPPFDAPGRPKAFRRNQMVFKIGRFAPFIPRALMKSMIKKLHENPNDIVDYLLPRVPPSDKAIISRPEVTQLLSDDQFEAYRQGPDGPLLETRLFTSPWDFEIEDIPVRVHVWQGDADIQVSVESARFVLSKLKDGVGHFIEGGGHYFIADGFPEILASVTEGDE